jgi:hypothetical protein
MYIKNICAFHAFHNIYPNCNNNLRESTSYYRHLLNNFIAIRHWEININISCNIY